MSDDLLHDANVRELTRWIDECDRITVLTGAGISTDSGIPDFRGPNGIWTKNPEAEKASNIQNFISDPKVRKASWRDRLDNRAWSADPNDGHKALVQLERRNKMVALLTQNVDGLHHAAGSSPAKVVEVHGTLREVACLECDYRDDMQVALNRVRQGEDDLDCPECGGILKSATISFGQSLVQRDLLRAEAAAQNCDLMIAIGTTLGVYPIAAVVPAAQRVGAKIAIINAEPTEMDHLADIVIRESISEVLSIVVRGVSNLPNDSDDQEATDGKQS
ncbi:MAG: Sir2 family NAD-dependent protein deacetylase [Actinomycetota bacterium]|uniref:Deacetylase sirtuin-type domain-containing protein n=1 Tax=marine metagenome TaxID=408172 RepID=A0A381PCM2_9ZZZZ|nr:Sir2 family NAD-dependent protein deacetylase [Actinomycetota bacterium]|tara:strand:+ start:2672 stop:3499 length:828 start_codon:yes stop_codon:yes gene_type:complete